MLGAFYHGALTPVSPSETAVSHGNRAGREQPAEPEEMGDRYTAVALLLTVTTPPPEHPGPVRPPSRPSDCSTLHDPRVHGMGGE